MLAPFVGAMVAASAFKYHQEITLEVERREQEEHQEKMNSSRSMNKIDVEDTRSVQSTLCSD